MPPPAIVALVDDDAEIRSAVESFLRSYGVTMYGFESAEAFLERVDEAKISCLITDLHMPGIGGVELLKRLRQRGVAYPIIVMSALDCAQAVSRTYGADACLSKPVDGEELIGWLDKLASG